MKYETDTGELMPFEVDQAGGARTLTDDVYFRLRRDIVSGRLAPDERLRLDALRGHYKIGLSPLREALSRLSSEGLVNAIGQRGFRVAPMSVGELHDICRLRILLETMALRESIANGTLDWEARIVASLHSLLNTTLPNAGEKPIDEWERRHVDFHAALISACDSPWLLRLCRMMTLQYERYRRRLIADMAESQALYEQIESEHRALAQAVVSRDTELATQLLDRHFRHVVKQIEMTVSAAGDHAPIDSPPSS